MDNCGFCVRCVTYILSLISSPLLYYRLYGQTWKRALSLLMPITIQRDFHIASPYFLHHALRVHTTLILTASSHWCPLYNRSYDKTAPRARITGNSCNAWPVTSVASTAGFRLLHGRGLHPSAIHHSSSPLGGMLTDMCIRCSSPNLGPPSRVAAGVNAAAFAYKS